MPIGGGGVRVRPNKSPRGDIPSKSDKKSNSIHISSWDWVGWINGGKDGKPKLQATEPPSHSEAHPITMAPRPICMCTVRYRIHQQPIIATDIGRPLPFSLTSQPTAAAPFEQPCPNLQSKASTYLRSNEQRNMVKWREEKKRRVVLCMKTIPNIESNFVNLDGWDLSRCRKKKRKKKRHY